MCPSRQITSYLDIWCALSQHRTVHSSTGLKNTVLGFIDTLYPGSICSIYLFVIIIKLLILLLLFVEWCFRLFWIWIYLRCVKFIITMSRNQTSSHTHKHTIHYFQSSYCFFYYFLFIIALLIESLGFSVCPVTLSQISHSSTVMVQF